MFISGGLQMDWTPIYIGAGVVLNWLILYFWQPWSTAYSGEKGKNIARKEDIDKISDEVRAVTRAQEEIKSSLAGDLWNRQLHKTQQKEIYGDLLALIHKVSGQLERLHIALTIREHVVDNEVHMEVVTTDIHEARRELEKLKREMVRLFGLASIFNTGECLGAMAKYLFKFDLPPNITKEWVDEQARLTGLFNADIIFVARKQLGIPMPTEMDKELSA
jgi:hypothetical protein